MTKNLRDLLLAFKSGEISLEEVEKQIKFNYFEEIENKLKLDVNRHFRTGVPEVVYGRGKELDEIIKATIKLAEKNGIALATKIEDVEKLNEEIKKYDLKNYIIKINKKAKTLIIKNKNYSVKKIGKVGILTAGTSDIPIAEEAKDTLEVMGVEVITYYDVGIAGIHRLFPALKKMVEENVCCIIVVAGMEGALPSVVSSMVDIPVIGVPTSTSYGIKITPLLTMLHTCSPGIVVVNIDNGFGAGVFAGLIAKKVYEGNHDKNHRGGVNRNTE
ncbi:nickel pincer cofactor biosynthesis protein LarB [Methanocaldococcus fervens]|uniref:1-(5-phosphoribosyl)-5-amino-4-imidazole-carboxylate (AIR) carboxylase n=1 Tax=Methanocaldococcus fervens (strain DSM 4213 / JCM 15782 / AG86) TaxID=573064 RepID=C7P648_METFA|nr:nickel pincer cofactor biosynthesis protein LarB [Methanocaldococcus fervens]ACV24030.1 1-(5-phosphoribosyl)-5-amino-4-imidazole-carboxylate (AIR) carboxylase [Methanocaldococcus fervens AG86]